VTTESLLRLPEVKRLVGLSRSEIYRRMRSNPPEFPRSVNLGVRAVAWPLSSIQEFIKARIRESRSSGGTK
jgi:prophage regulatory protein